MGRLFGTDGARGVANTELTCELAMNIGRAAAMVLTDNTHRHPRILIGKDTRISSDMLEGALTAGLCSVGADVISLGVIPTPAVAFLVGKYKADHRAPYLTPEGGDIGRVSVAENAVKDYIDHIKATVPFALDGMRIALDCANGSASRTAERLFTELGAQVYMLSDQPNGVNINDNCGSTHMESLMAFVKENHLDAGVAFDGDADRCLAVDNQGNLVDGDFVMAICALDMKSRGKLAKNTVVGTIMTNMGFIRFCEENGMNFVATKVGDRYVLEEMLLEEYSFGGEQSGHVIFLDFGTTGDGQLTAAQLISILKRRQAKLSSLATLMERYPQVMVNVRVSPEGKLRFYTDADVKAATEQAKAVLGKTGRIVVRVSGTEPLIRVMVEGEQEETINRLANEVADVIREKLV